MVVSVPIAYIVANASSMVKGSNCLRKGSVGRQKDIHP